MTLETTPLPARPLNHLSVLSYLAIGIVVFASSLVTGYLIHSCYRSASRKDAIQNGALETFTTGDAESGSGMVYRKATSRRDLGVEFELKPLAKEFYSDKESFLSDSRTVIGNRSDLSFDKDTFINPSSHLGHSSDSPVATSFHLLPPSSPSPAHKKQMRQFAGQAAYSPVSPVFPDASPPYVSLPYHERDTHAEQHVAATTKTNGTNSRGAPSIHFDSNNIRYIPALGPCVADPTVKLYNEPKLSPVHGSIIPPSPTSDSPLRPNHGRKPNSSQYTGVAPPSSTNSSLIPMSPRRIRVLCGETSSPTILPRLPESSRKENMSPISSQRIGNHSWEATVRRKPGPGYF